MILSLNFLNRIDLFTLITAGNILVSRSLKVRISGVYVPFILILPTCCYFLSIIFELSFELNLKQTRDVLRKICRNYRIKYGNNINIKTDPDTINLDY